jgi:LysR family transcriptional regulator, regulator for bpeEF and oprC
MDHLRALRYFMTSAKSGSFTQAAGQLGVTVPAVQKLVGQLERELGVVLLARSSQGLTLTASGMRYLSDIEHLLAELEHAGNKIKPRKNDLSGLVVVATPTYLIAAVFEPAFSAFAQRYPEITLEFRALDTSEDISRAGVDVYLCHGWYSPPDLVQRILTISQFVTLASPEFWNRHGRPTHPNELRTLPCLTMRAPNGTLMDLWDYERNGEIVRVPVKGAATFENSHRDALMRLVLKGHGALRTSDFLTRELLARGELEAVLSDWRGIGAPPVRMLFRNDARRFPAVNAVLDFIAEQFEGLRQPEDIVPPRPDWASHKLSNASLQLTRRSS